MGNANSSGGEKSTPATASERRLRGDDLEGSEQKNSVQHAKYERTRQPDTDVRLDDEKDTLYNDGLDIEDDGSDTLAGTRGPSSGIKP